MNQEDFQNVAYYERIIWTLMMMNDSLKKDRVSNLLSIFFKVMENNSSDYAFANLFSAMLIKFAKKDKYFRNCFYGHKLVDKVHKWIGANSSPPLQSTRSQFGIYKSNKYNTKMSYDVINDEVNCIKELNNKLKNEMKSMHKKPDEFIDPDLESEDDLYENELEAGAKLDFIPSGSYKWSSGTVVLSLGDILRVQKDEGEMEVDGISVGIQEHWVNRDDQHVAPHQSKAQNVKAQVANLFSKAMSF